MSILNVNQIQPVGGGNTITISASDVSASGATITATSFVGSVTGTTSNASGATGDFSIADKIVHTGDTDTAIRFPAADTITAETAATERFRITSTGLVGIGTDNPGAQSTSANNLVVADFAGEGGITIKNGNSSSGNIFFADEAATAQGRIQYNHANDYLRFFTGGDNERLRIKSDGKVGIGTNNPTRGGLHIHKASTAELHLTDDTTGSGSGDGLTVFSTISSAGVWYRENANLRFATNNTERMIITSGGNVDINGTPPWSVTGGNYRNLSISGSDASSSGFLWLGNGAAATNADFDLGRVNFVNGTNIVAQIKGTTQTGANDDGRIAFLTKSTGSNITERLRITSAGVIQCGTSSVLKAEINNAVSGHQFISQCSDNNNGFEVYQQHGSNTTRNTFAVYANTGNSNAKNLQFAVRGDGVVTSPQQPAFRAVDNSAITLTAGSPAVFNSTSHFGGFNRGGHYNTSNGRFTAPIAGVYHFQASLGTNGWSSGNTSQDNFTLRVNNNAYVYSIKRENIDSANSANGYFTDYGTFTVNLSANDYVTVVPSYNNNSFGNASYTWFEGFLIG